MVGENGAIDVSLDQDMDEVAALSVLTMAQKAALLKRIHEGIKALSGKPFTKAVQWAVNVFGFAALNSIVGAPPTGYGASFTNFAAYIMHKRKQLADEQEAEELEHELQ